MTLPLFNHFPGLQKSLPYTSIGSLPTSIAPLPGLAEKLSYPNLFVKHDDLTGQVYGGNKVRKLEFLLADALKRGAKRVITSGAAGSNHCLATALYARAAGLKATIVLSDQPISPIVRANLLMDGYLDAEMIYEAEYANFNAVIHELVERYTLSEGVPPYVIPAGGSSPVGALGYVNAAFELKEQIDRGQIREPGAIFLALGTMGTAVGLLLGIKAAGIGSRIVGVRVIPPVVANMEKFEALYRDVNDLLHRLDPSFPIVPFVRGDITFCHDYFEPGYGLASTEVTSAVAQVERTDALHLDITYTGKAFAAYISAARKKTYGSAPMLFWNTKNSRELPEEAQRGDYKRLPAEFWRFFEGE